MKYLFYALLCLFSHLALAEPLHKVYRADRTPPDVIRGMQGFFAKGVSHQLPLDTRSTPCVNISLWNHANGDPVTQRARDDSCYISTTQYLNIAEQRIVNIEHGSGFIYHIQGSWDFIDVNGSLGHYSPYQSEHEEAALIYISWPRIIGWQEYTNGVAGNFINNPDYIENLYPDVNSVVLPQLAGFPPGNNAWSEDPWNQYANCGQKRDRKCYPKKSAQAYGEDFFWFTYRREQARMLYVIGSSERAG